MLLWRVVVVGTVCLWNTVSSIEKKKTTIARTHTTTTPAAESSEEDEIDWQCGTDFISKLMSEGQIEADCPSLKVPINNCCIVHDDCYDKQKGRTFCDETFCKCLDVATKSSAMCNKEDGPLFCVLVKELGDDAYRAAGNITLADNSTTTASPRVKMGDSKKILSSTLSTPINHKSTTRTSQKVRPTPVTVTHRPPISSTPSAIRPMSGLSPVQGNIHAGSPLDIPSGKSNPHLSDVRTIQGDIIPLGDLLMAMSYDENHE